MTTKFRPAFPVLGARIASRKKGSADRFIFSVLIFLWILVGLGFSLGVGPFPWWWANLLLGAPIVLAVSALAAGALFRVVEFYEHAAVERIFSRHRVFRYSEVLKLDFLVVRRYVNFVYSGTVFRMRLVMADGRKLRIQEQYEGIDDRIEIARNLIEKYPKAERTFGERSESSGSQKNSEGKGSAHAVDSASVPKKRYYVWHGYQEQGPYTMKQLRAALQEKTFTNSTPVRADNEIDSQQLKDLLRQRPSKKSQH